MTSNKSASPNAPALAERGFENPAPGGSAGVPVRALAPAPSAPREMRPSARQLGIVELWRRGSGRPLRLWLEMILLAVSYGAYSLIRNAVPEHETSAFRHARSIWAFEQRLGIGVEKAINHAVNRVEWLIVGMNYYYATLHFAVTLAVLIWLYRGHARHFSAGRTVLLVGTGLALLGFAFYPLAPPRLMTNVGFIDTVAVHHTWGAMSSPSVAPVSNQFAAMPSMHFGWSLWCGLTIVLLARRRWVKILGVAYPLATLTVIVATANHFWMDAVGGALCIAVGAGLATLMYRASERRGAGSVARLDRSPARP